MISQTEIILRLLLGAVLGGIIGFERQTHGRPAGFRTQLLVCVASVLFMVVSEYHHYLGSIDPSYMRIDPARIAQGAITGVGFLGAGVILKMGFTIQGLTTAACIWMVSAIGIAVGSGLYLAGVAATAITYLSLWVLRTAERRITKLVFRTLTVLADESLGEEDVSAVIRRHGVSVSGVDYKRDIVGKKVEYRFTITLRQEAAAKRILDELSSLGPVKALTLKA